MKKFIIVAIINLFALLLVSNIIKGITIYNWQTYIAASIVLTFINLFLKPVLKIIFLPINILTLGFFTLIINALILYTTSSIIKGFYVHNFFSAFWGALLLSIIYIILETFILGKNSKTFISRDDESKEELNSSNIIDVEEIKDDKKNN